LLKRRPFRNADAVRTAAKTVLKALKETRLRHYSSELYNRWVECIAVWDYYDEKNI